MKKLTDEEKKKRKSTIGKIIAFIVIIAISIACSKYNFVDIGHDFFMTIFSVATGQSVEEPVNTLAPTDQSLENNDEDPSTNDESNTSVESDVSNTTEEPEVTAETDEQTTQETTTETEQTTTE